MWYGGGLRKERYPFYFRTKWGSIHITIEWEKKAEMMLLLNYGTKLIAPWFLSLFLPPSQHVHDTLWYDIMLFLINGNRREIKAFSQRRWSFNCYSSHGIQFSWLPLEKTSKVLFCKKSSNHDKLNRWRFPAFELITK
jgi:hypothetical protein